MFRSFSRTYSLKCIINKPRNNSPLYEVFLSNINIVGIPFDINLRLFESKKLSDIELHELSRNISFLTSSPVIFKKIFGSERFYPSGKKTALFEIIQSRELEKAFNIIDKYGKMDTQNTFPGNFNANTPDNYVRNIRYVPFDLGFIQKINHNRKEQKHILDTSSIVYVTKHN